MQQPGIDLRGLARRARGSEERESFEVIEQTEFVRISVGARIAESDEPAYVVEIIVYPCPSGCPIDVSLLESQLGLVKDLGQMGYSVCCQDGGFIVGEGHLDPKDLELGLKALGLAVMNRFETGGGD